MKPVYRYIIISTYSVLSLIVFWYAQFFLKCTGFLCSLLPTLSLWIPFIVISFLIYLVKPFTIKQSLLRFFISASIVIAAYCVVYTILDYSTQSKHQWFLDYSLPGMLLTIGFTVSWLLPKVRKSN